MSTRSKIDKINPHIVTIGRAVMQKIWPIARQFVFGGALSGEYGFP